VIAAVLFDFDGVLTTDKSGSVSTIRSLSLQTGLGEEALWDAFAPFNEELLYGRTTHADVWPAICDRLGHQMELSLLLQAFDSTPICHEMLGYAASLKPHYATAVITDNKADRMDRLRHRYALDTIFRPIIVSAEHGSGKQQPLLFERALELLATSPEQCVFIDNSHNNLVAPAALGINTVYFNESIDTAESLAELLRTRYGVVAPQVTPNSSSKPTPLRGAA